MKVAYSAPEHIPIPSVDFLPLKTWLYEIDREGIFVLMKKVEKDTTISPEQHAFFTILEHVTSIKHATS